MKNNNKSVEVYNYLLNRCDGRENGVPAQVLANELKMPLRRLREVVQAINESPQFERLISVTQKIYICATEEECRRAVRATIRQATTLLKKGRAMIKKANANGQYKMKLSDCGEALSFAIECYYEVG